MNSENQFETIILKILESDPQLLVSASVVLVILIVIGVFFVKTLKKLFSDETQTPPLSEKDRLKKLEELDVTSVEPMAHAVPLANVLRADEVRPSITQEAALANAPKQANGLFIVPKIVE